MANNSMWLYNRITGDRIKIAKFYPSSGWYTVGSETIGERMDIGFEADRASEDTDAWHGPTNWVVLYEFSEDPALEMADGFMGEKPPIVTPPASQAGTTAQPPSGPPKA
jgi:hypothetical protein